MTGEPEPAPPCAICSLHAHTACTAAYEIARTDLWVLHHHPDPATAAWSVADLYRAVAAARELVEWNPPHGSDA